MSSTSELPGWFVPLFVLGFPIAFASIWSLVCAILATVSGYRSLAGFQINKATANEGESLPSPLFAMIGSASYRGRILKLRANPAGLTLRILRIFLFHPPVQVPWERIREDGDSRIFGSALILDDRVRLTVPAETFAAIRDAKARYAG